MTEGAVSAANGVGMSQNRPSPCGIFEKIAPRPAEFAKNASLPTVFSKKYLSPCGVFGLVGGQRDLAVPGGDARPYVYYGGGADVGGVMEFSF